MGLLVFILICWGLTNVLATGQIAKPIRNFFEMKPSRVCQFIADLINCPMCLGFWVGLLMSVLFFSPSITYMGVHSIPAALMDGFVASGSTWVVFCVVKRTGCYYE